MPLKDEKTHESLDEELEKTTLDEKIKAQEEKPRTFKEILDTALVMKEIQMQREFAKKLIAKNICSLEEIAEITDSPLLYIQHLESEVNGTPPPRLTMTALLAGLSGER